MASTSAKVLSNIMSAPLPEMVERLGFAVASAQLAMDQNSIAIANAMAITNVGIVDREFNLIELGFTPTFYSFTEATIHVKMEFAMMEGENFTIGGDLNLDIKTDQVVFGLSINAQYSRKYEVNVEASSSITARLVSLPPPDRLKELLNEVAADAEIPIESMIILVPASADPIEAGDSVQLVLAYLPANTTNTEVEWSINPSSSSSTISSSGLLQVDEFESGTITVMATSTANPAIFANHVFYFSA